MQTGLNKTFGTEMQNILWWSWQLRPEVEAEGSKLKDCLCYPMQK